jgi:hypothetical protein
LIELKVQNHSDRNNVVTALANNGYAVRVVERKVNSYSLEKEYFVQIVLDKATDPIINITQHVSVEKQADIDFIFTQLDNKFKKCGFTLK